MSIAIFQYNIGNDINLIKTDEIVFLRNNKRIIELYVWNRETDTIILANKFYSIIKDALNQLPACKFYRCERSHIVNMDYIDQMESSAFILVDANKSKVPISRSRKSEAREVYDIYRTLA